jgi:thiosulfate reductase cytochrome b subunit
MVSSGFHEPDAATAGGDAVAAPAAGSRRSAWVRWSHWIATLASAALLVTGVEILLSHPRFYWGDEGNVNVPPAFTLPLPASRSSVPTGYGFVLKDQNGWSRSVHFQAGWALAFAGCTYVGYGLVSGHFRRNLLPKKGEWGLRPLAKCLAAHRGLRTDGDLRSYNLLQRLAYLCVVWVLFPGMVWTGFAMSPALTAICPFLEISVGGRQSARTLHFFDTILLSAFVCIHVLMVVRNRIGDRMRSMITGRYPEEP